MTTMAEKLASGLKRSAIKTVTQWAEQYREMGQPFPGKFSVAHHPWQGDMMDCEAEMVIGQKAAQMGYTEVALNKTFKAIDVDGISVLYILPATTPDASDFSTSRFDPALEMSDHLQNLFTDVKNIGHKRAGNANLYIRGSRSRSQLKSIPVGLAIFDEVDEMVKENIPLAFERMSGQLEHQAFLLSTPTIDKAGINAFFKNSTQNHYFFKCPSCSRTTELTFPECLEITAEEEIDPKIRESFIKCKECGARLNQDTKLEWLGKDNALWVPAHSDRLNVGFYINQLYSMTIQPWQLAVSYLKSLINPADEQEFYNSKLGLPHVVKGARITDVDIEKCTGNYMQLNKAKPGTLVTFGADVGKWIHYEIDEWEIRPQYGINNINLMAKCRVIKVGKVKNFEELDSLFPIYQIRYGVIDAAPETRKALEFCQRHWGHTKMCYYGRGVSGKQIHEHDEKEHSITVNRTSWLDMSLSRFRAGTITLPKDVGLEYQNHLKAPVRVYKKDADGNITAKYEKADNDHDHHAHARNYAEIALTFSFSLMANKNIKDVY